MASFSSGTATFHVQNETQNVRFSLIEYEEEPGSEDVLIGQGENVVKSVNKSDIIIAGHVPTIDPPPSRPPTESSPPLLAAWNTLVSTVLTLLFILCLPVLFLIYFFLGVLPRMIIAIGVHIQYMGRFEIIPSSKVFGSTDWNHHTVVVVCRGRCDLQKLRAYLAAAATATHDRFSFLRKRVEKRFGYLWWEDMTARFDIKNHVKHFDSRTRKVSVDMDDIMPFLESTYQEPFENHLTAPQWEVLVVPKYAQRQADSKLLSESDRCRRHYCLIFRFQHGIMNWNAFQTLLVEALGKTNGRIRSIFGPEMTRKNLSLWTKCKIFLAAGLVGPQKFIKKSYTPWKRLPGIKRRPPFLKFLAMSRTIGTECIEDIKDRTLTSVDTVLGNCVRIAVRNMSFGQNAPLPKCFKITRIFNMMTDSFPQVDTFQVNFEKYRSILQRLHASFLGIDGKQINLAGQRAFNKLLISLAGEFPVNVVSWIYKMMMRGDLVLELWPGADQPCKILDGDVITDMFGWSGIKGTRADFKVTITTYCDRIRANFTGKLGTLAGGRTDAAILAAEFEEEYKLLASMAGFYPNRWFLPPVVRDYD